jgi:hypothetical protein
MVLQRSALYLPVNNCCYLVGTVLTEVNGVKNKPAVFIKYGSLYFFFPRFWHHFGLTNAFFRRPLYHDATLLNMVSVYTCTYAVSVYVCMYDGSFGPHNCAITQFDNSCN